MVWLGKAAVQSLCWTFGSGGRMASGERV